MGDPQPDRSPPRPAGFTVPYLRWGVAAFLLLLSVLNYIDRQALSILAKTIQDELKLSDLDYARVGGGFLACYTAMYLLSGRIVDRLGPRWAEALFIAWWSVAAMLTGLTAGFWSLMAFRCLLGIGEPGHYAASAKVVSQWFPASERGVAVGMYVMGGTLGAAVAAVLVPALTREFGWRMAFALTGAAGLVLAAAWWAFYRTPARHPWLGDRERRLLDERGVLAGGRPAPPARWAEVLGLWPVWLLLLAKMLTDSVWYFYLLWFAKYLQAARGFALEDLGWAGVIFLAADAGCVLGGWLSGRLVRRGHSPLGARLLVMGGAAFVLAWSFTLPWLPGRVLPLAAASLFTCAVMVWMTNSVTLVIDLVPARMVGSAQGLIGAGGSLGGALSQELIGKLVTHYSYNPVYSLMSIPHPVALAVLALLLPRVLRGARADGPPTPPPAGKD